MSRICAVVFAGLSLFSGAGGAFAQNTVKLHLDRGKSILMADPRAALAEANAARAALPPSIYIGASDRRNENSLRTEWLIGAALISLDRAPEALEALERGIHIEGDSRSPSSQIFGDLVFAHATALIYVGRFEQALIELRRAYKIYGDVRYQRGQALALQNIAMIYFQARDYPHAIEYFRSSLAIAGTDVPLLLSISNNEADVLREQGDFKKAQARYEYALSLARSIKSPTLQVRVLSGLADAQLRAGNIAEARTSINEGMRVSSSTSSTAWTSALYTAAARAALERGAIGEARSLIDKALGAGRANSVAILRDAHQAAYEIYKSSGDQDGALRHLEAFKQLDDQTRSIAASANVALMAAQFDFANQRASIAQLKTTEIQNEATIARNQRAILTILLAGSGLVTILLLIGFISIRRSRNEVRAANEELSETNVELEHALEARTQFLATTSHEIRTPLNGILGMTQVLLADRALDEGVRGRIELVHGAGETMRALVDDILDVAKMTTGELTLHPAEMDLGRLLADTVQVWDGQAQAKGIGIVLEADGAPARIVADEVRLRQILFNLVANAVKFTDRGQVRIAARAMPGDGDAADGERLAVAISDTGVGIPPDKLEEIFESFRQVDGGTTRRHGGTGLGLAICRKLAEAMGGAVRVSSVLGAGATFTLDVPLVRGAERPVRTDRAAARTLDTARLLLVEANPLSQSILRAVLGPRVATLAVAGNADEARAAIEAELPDLLLLDAATLARDIAAAGALAAPVTAAGRTAVLLYPAPDDDVRAAARTSGIGQVIATPIAPPELVASLLALYVSDRSTEEIAA